MNKIIYISFLILISCSESSNKKYYKSGNIKEAHFYNKENNKLDSTVYYFDSFNSFKGKIVRRTEDNFFCISNYSSNGQKLSQGVRNTDSIRVDNWSFYKEDTIEILEYKDIRGEEYLNQSWIKNSKGDTIGGNYVLLKTLKDTVNVNEIVSLRFYLKGFMFSEDSELFYVLPKYGENFDKKFTNEFEINTDTIKSLKYDKLNQHLKDWPLNHMLMVNFEFESQGKKHLRGILNEIQGDSIIKERSIYFDKEIYVK